MIDEGFDFEDEPELEPQPLVPITNNPLPMGPFAKKRGLRKKMKTTTAENYRKGLQRLLYRIQMPMSLGQLTSLEIGELKCIASFFKDYDVTAKSWREPRLIEFIQGRQNDPSQYRPLERLPGVKYPDISDQEYRRLFERQLDPWKRPGRD